LYIVIIVFYLKVELVINGSKQKRVIIKELFEGLVWDYCIARNTIKYLLYIDLHFRPTSFTKLKCMVLIEYVAKMYMTYANPSIAF